MSDDPERERALGIYRDSQRLEKTIGRLKRAMIDSFMAEKVFGATFGHGGNRFQFKRDEYLLRSSQPLGGDDHVARPDEFGEGGGRAWKTMIPGVWDQSYSDSKELDYTAEFEDVRTWVDNLDLAGGTVEAFRTKFVVNLRMVLNGHSCVAALLASSMAAQRGAWEEVGAGFVLIIETYTQVFNSLAGLDGSPDANVQVRILRYAAAAAADGPWATLLNGAAAALGLVALSRGEAPQDNRSPESFAQGKAALDGALDALNRGLYETEKRIRDTITDSMEEIGSIERIVDGRQYPDNRQNYDLALAPITDFSVTHPERIGWDGGTIASIVNGPMHEIAEGLHDQLRITTTWDLDIAETVKRHALLGLGTYGPSAAVHELNEVLCDLLGDLKWEVETGASQLWLAYDANMRCNDQAAADLAALNAQLPQGSGYDPWDFQPGGLPSSPEGRVSVIPIWRMMSVPEFETKPEVVEAEPTEYQWQERGK